MRARPADRHWDLGSAIVDGYDPVGKIELFKKL
jgi:hypothetical protein